MTTKWEYAETEIKNIDDLLKGGYEIEILGADGYQPVIQFMDKGKWEGFICKNLSNDNFVIVNQDHLFETDCGWKKAKDLSECNILMDSGLYEKCYITKTSDIYNIVDIEVGHPNHRYYANGFSSHNSHVGKTAHMCSLAADFISQGFNVLYVTLEIAEEEIASRIDANLMNVPVGEVKKLSKDMFNSKIFSMKNKHLGNFIIKEFPPATISVIHIRSLLNELELKFDFIPDILILDYMNLMTSARLKAGDNIYQYYKSISEEVRGLAVEKNISIWTGGQLNRGGMGSSDPEAGNMAESIGAFFTGDFIYALIADEDMKSRGVVLVKQMKNRYDDMNKIPKFFLGFEREYQRFYDVDDALGGINTNGPVADETKFGKVENELIKADSKRFEGFNFD